MLIVEPAVKIDSFQKTNFPVRSFRENETIRPPAPRSAGRKTDKGHQGLHLLKYPPERRGD
jgi:hypothetical protein